MLQVYVNNNPEDYSVTAGRISATFILHEMFIKNPIIGIGMGNYPLLRNLDEYRSFFPVISIFDASGYGGIIDVINQFGLLGLILWGMILKKIYHLTSNWKIVFFYLSFLSFLCTNDVSLSLVTDRYHVGWYSNTE